jgi:hypothetical protein
VAEDHRANRKDGNTDSDNDGGLLLGNGWRRFHDQLNRNGIIVFRRAEQGSAFFRQCRRQHAFSGHGQMKPEQLEIAQLKREVVKLKAERDILKKAAAYFAKEST